MNKKKLILASIIEEYLKSLEPVSSKQLMDSISIKISSASIRNYFAKLSDDGELDQLHVSSGRIPTSQALKNFWLQRIDLSNINFENIDVMLDRSDRAGLFFVFEHIMTNRLQEVINVQDRYLLLVFDRFEIVLEHSVMYEKFLSEFIGNDLDELAKIAQTLKIDKIANDLQRQKVFHNTSYNGVIHISNIFTKESQLRSFTSGDILKKLDDGFYFDEIVPKDYMAIKTKAKFQNSPIDLFCLGRLDSDFGYFLAS